MDNDKYYYLIMQIKSLLDKYIEKAPTGLREWRISRLIKDELGDFNDE
tara:strand:+ start:455 stop:598 length:144 start_codon:yes stop_codon:yes gene_type:complete